MTFFCAMVRANNRILRDTENFIYLLLAGRKFSVDKGKKIIFSTSFVKVMIILVDLCDYKKGEKSLLFDSRR